MTLRVLDTTNTWKLAWLLLPAAPTPGDPRGETVSFHGRYRDASNTGLASPELLGLPEFGGTISTTGTLYENRHFLGMVTVSGSGNTFRNCKFEAVSGTYGVNATANVTLIDCEIDGGSSTSSGACANGPIHAVRCHIHGGADGIRFVTDALYEDCYVHSQNPHYGGHSDASQILGGNNAGVLRSKLLAYHVTSGEQFNACIQFGSISSQTDNFQMIDNYFDGGNYSINGNVNVAFVTNMVAAGNRFGRQAQYGAATTSSRATGTHGTFDATNVYDDTGLPV